MKELDRRALEAIAALTHEINRIYCESIGDTSQPYWDSAPDWQRKSAVEGVLAILSGRIRTPADSHASWLEAKMADGWTYGPVKDPERKRHPCLVAYEELPPSQRAKDHLFLVVVQGAMAVVREVRADTIAELYREETANVQAHRAFVEAHLKEVGTLNHRLVDALERIADTAGRR